jgi:hypothetical protein
MFGIITFSLGKWHITQTTIEDGKFGNVRTSANIMRIEESPRFKNGLKKIKKP